MEPHRPLSRRRFLQASAGAGGLLLGACHTLDARRVVTRGRLRHAAVGVGGMGGIDLEQIASHPDVDIVALCDVDANALAAAAKRFPLARRYVDWRRCLDESEDVDSVHVTVPDHMHASIAMEALERGKHVYCQKPLTRTVAEARAVAEAARRAGTTTQMGIQNHSLGPLRSARALYGRDLIGSVYEVHVWTDRPAGWWPQGVGRAPGSDPVPASLAWNLWLGAAPQRPYKDRLYHPFSWRGFEDFGTGAQGDMGCHLMDPAVWFLGLGTPTRLRSDGPPPNGETYPLWSEVGYEFPADRRARRGPVVLTWHDGGRKAPRALLDGLGAGEVVANACLFVGDRGALLASPYDPPRLLPADQFSGVSIPNLPALNHWHQWVDACRGEGEASAPFSYAAHLTEIVLLGNVALRFPHETLDWDGATASFPNRPEADRWVGSRYRDGWRKRDLEVPRRPFAGWYV